MGPYTHEIYPNGYVRFASVEHVFIRFRGRWEFYLLEPRGACRGLEQFAGYVTEPKQIATLEHALCVAERMGPKANAIRPNHSRSEENGAREARPTFA